MADEPTGNLDPESGMHIARLLHSLPGRGQAVLMATHNHQLVQTLPARSVVIRDKQIHDM